MPARRNVQIWRHRYPTFALRLERARQLGGFGGRGRPSSYDPARAERLLERIVAGEAPAEHLPRARPAGHLHRLLLAPPPPGVRPGAGHR
ncbi:hypothetical protein [Phenylobacterium sp. J367]|uniref:hypothetical protein n=1 Tax=Phenylobacterium sp. J367 TaxID=2898435 RepID=UPI0035B1FDFF